MARAGASNHELVRRAQSRVGQPEQHVGVAWLVERTPACKVATGQLMPDVVDRETQDRVAQDESLFERFDHIATSALRRHPERVSPTRRTGHDHRACRLAPAGTPRQLNTPSDSQAGARRADRVDLHGFVVRLPRHAHCGI